MCSSCHQAHRKSARLWNQFDIVAELCTCNYIMCTSCDAIGPKKTFPHRFTLWKRDVCISADTFFLASHPVKWLVYYQSLICVVRSHFEVASWAIWSRWEQSRRWRTWRNLFWLHAPLSSFHRNERGSTSNTVYRSLYNTHAHRPNMKGCFNSHCFHTVLTMRHDRL